MTIHTETVIDEAAAQRIAEINAKRDRDKNPHRRLWMNLLSVILLGMGAWYLFDWVRTGLSLEEGSPTLGVILLLMGLTLLYYANSDPVKLNLVRIRKSLGTRWYYDFGEDGITSLYDGEEQLFPWDFALNWWEEQDYFCVDVSGSPIVVPKKQFNMKQRAALRELLDKNVRIRSDDEVRRELREKKRQERTEEREQKRRERAAKK